MLVDLFKSFRKNCLRIYELDPAHFISTPRWAWHACLKKKKFELRLLTDIDVLLMVKKDFRGEICRAVHRYLKANNNYIKYYNQSTELPYLMYWDVRNLYGWAMTQKLPADGFK